MMHDRSKGSGYRGIAVGYDDRPGIVVIDFQKSHTSQEFPFSGHPLMLRALENTRELLAVACPLGIPVAVGAAAYQSERDMPKMRAARKNGLARQHGN